jgi:hypothetical protein
MEIAIKEECVTVMENKMKVTMCDPPSGWLYGFPKAMPQDLKSEDFMNWLISEGYPKEEIEKMGNHFYCRHWHEESDGS